MNIISTITKWIFFQKQKQNSYIWQFRRRQINIIVAIYIYMDTHKFWLGNFYDPVYISSPLDRSFKFLSKTGQQMDWSLCVLIF